MARSPLPVALFLCCICFLFSTAHAGYRLTGRGFREVDIAKVLANIKPVQLPVARVNNRYTCSRGDALVRVGSEWTERCRQCRCTEAGAECTSEVTCPKPYKAMQEITCAKWSANQCCCEEEGCMSPDGTMVPVGGAMPLDPARPCYSCTCTGANRTKCLMTDWTRCPMQCVDGYRVQGQCCHHCPNGRTCFMPFKETRGMSRAELQSLRPVAESSPVVLHQGTPSEVTCTCEAGSMMAKCRPAPSAVAGETLKKIPLVV